jgi:hypothetical protein
VNLQLVTGQAFGTRCKGCNKRVVGGDQSYEQRTITPFHRIVYPVKVYADMDGTPFDAYYCEECANQIKTVQS